MLPNEYKLKHWPGFLLYHKSNNKQIKEEEKSKLQLQSENCLHSGMCNGISVFRFFCHLLAFVFSVIISKRMKVSDVSETIFLTKSNTEDKTVFSNFLPALNIKKRTSK